MIVGLPVVVLFIYWIQEVEDRQLRNLITMGVTLLSIIALVVWFGFSSTVSRRARRIGLGSFAGLFVLMILS